MQLIVDTETTLDIDKNMSTIEDKHNNKGDSLDIEDFNKKCNGIKDTENNSIKEGKKDLSELDQALSNIPNEVKNNEAELSNVDLSKIISQQNCLEANGAQTLESQNHSSEKEINGSNNVENVLEDDYLEDDIISINEEAFAIIPEKASENEKETYIIQDETKDIAEETTNTVEIDDNFEDDIISINEEAFAIIPEKAPENEKETCLIQDETKDIAEETTNTVEIDDNLEDDIISINEEAFAIIPEKAPENEKGACLIQDETKDIAEETTNTVEIDDNLEDDIISINKEAFAIIPENGPENERETYIHDETKDIAEESTNTVEIDDNKPIEDDNDVIEVLEESEATPVPSEEGTVLLKHDDVMDTGEAPPLHWEKETESIEKERNCIDLVEESTVSPLQCEMETEALSIKETDDLNVTESDSSIPRVNESNDTLCKLNDKIDLLDDETEQLKDNIENIIEPNIKNTNNETCMDLPKEEHENKIEETKDIVLEENEIESLDDPDETITSVLCDNTTDASMEVNEINNGNKSKHDPANCSDTSEGESSVEIVNTGMVVSQKSLKDDAMDIDKISEEKDKEITKPVNSPIVLKDDMDVDEVVEETISKKDELLKVTDIPLSNTTQTKTIDKSIICKLSNTLDILSDDDEEESIAEPSKAESPNVEPPKVTESDAKQCINIEDDDDIMVIDEVTNKTDTKASIEDKKENLVVKPDVTTDSETGEKTVQDTSDLMDETVQKEATTPVAEIIDTNLTLDIKEKSTDTKIEKPGSPAPLVPQNFLKTAKKELAEMTREELEEFCILKIVESVIDRSSLGDIKSKLKTMTQGLDEYRKKTMLLTKQNRDLQLVLKSVQEEQKKATGDTPITPLKITRSVGMQVFMDKLAPRKKPQQQTTNIKTMNTPPIRNTNTQGVRPQKPASQNIPVPRLVPANNPAMKTPNTLPQVNQINSPNKNISPQNGIVKTPSPTVKPEKRPFSKITPSSVTVDLTDDEPPSKMPGGPKTSPAPPVRLVPSQNLMAPQRQPFGTTANSPRKVYIPISGPQSQNLRPGQTIMLKTVPTPGMRARGPAPQIPRVEANTIRMNRVAARHPAPLPLAMKQYQPPNWKTLPPAPDLKLSKVENGIVISWKIENIPEDSYEEIASYQLYAYQETASPPSSALWKKIGDVKALPLPMACTLTQFMAGFKYYFAVRAVDIRSRLGPFSLPGSILLLSKNI